MTYAITLFSLPWAGAVNPSQSSLTLSLYPSPSQISCLSGQMLGGSISLWSLSLLLSKKGRLGSFPLPRNPWQALLINHDACMCEVPLGSVPRANITN